MACGGGKISLVTRDNGEISSGSCEDARFKISSLEGGSEISYITCDDGEVSMKCHESSVFEKREISSISLD